MYEVSSLGNIRSIKRYITNRGTRGGGYILNGKQLKVCRANNGYYVVNLGHNKTQLVHRLVCEAFIGKIPKGMTVNHKDGNKANNRVENLEILSYRDNHLHAFRVLYRRPTCLGKLNTNASKPVQQIKKNGDIIIYPSAREAERQTGIRYKYISACCHGKLKSAGGYEWRFAKAAILGLNNPEKAPFLP